MTITLTPELEQALSERAKRQGTTPEVLAIDVLRQQILPEDQKDQKGKDERARPGETMADFLEGYVGVVDSREIIPGGARLSEDCGGKFAEGLLEKRRQGKL